MTNQQDREKAADEQLPAYNNNPAEALIGGQQELNITIEDNGTAVKKRNRWSRIINVFLMTLIVFLLFLIVFMNCFILCPVKKTSMMPGIRDGQRVLLLKTKRVENGDIFVFESEKIDPLTGKKMNLIKRVIASGGDRLLFVRLPKDNNGDSIIKLYRDTGDGFVLLEENYINAPMVYQFAPEWEHYKTYVLETEELNFNLATKNIIEIPKDCYYAIGDNRNVSSDSRSEDIGIVKKSKIIGRLSAKLTENSLIERLLKILYHDTEAG